MELLQRPSYFRLGAEELLELGSARGAVPLVQRPFLAGRQPRPALGDIFSDIGGFITGALGFALNTLGDLVNLPLGILSTGVDTVFNGLANLLDNIPIMGPFLGQILLLGNAVIKFALSVPGLLLHGLGGILTNISKVLTTKNTPAQNQKNVDQGKNNIVNQAPSTLQSAVKSALNSTGVTGQNMTPALQPGSQTQTLPEAVAQGQSGVDLANVLTIAVPAVGATAILFMLMRG